MIETYTPQKLPRLRLKWSALIEEIGQAHRTLGRFDEIIQSVEQPAIILSIMKTKEALDSLEYQVRDGKRPTLIEALSFKVDSKNQEVLKEIRNYLAALEAAVAKTAQGLISLTLLRQIHAILKKDEPIAKTDLGQFRNRQNWIGPVGCSIEEAYFYPPPAHLVKAYMVNLEKYIRYDEKDVLVQLAVIFAQLLIIHPFMDGNGRIGRILVPIFLCKKKLISKPLFYLSHYFQKNRLKYLENLFNISQHKDWDGWIRFFLRGIIEEGERNITQAKKIITLYYSTHESISELLPSTLTKKILHTLFQHPMFTADEFSKFTRLTHSEVYKILKSLEQTGIVLPTQKALNKNHAATLKFEQIIRAC